MILITGATGRTGGATVEVLRDKGVPVRVLVRDPAKLGAAEGVDVAVGDFRRGETLDAALKGIESAYLVAPGDERLVEMESTFVDAARRAGVSHIVRLSAINADQSISEGVRFNHGHAVMEGIVRNSGMQWTILRANNFMQNYLGQAQTIAEEGAFYSPLSPDVRMAHIDVGDIGAVAAHVLTENGHDGHEYDLTGPEALSDDEVAARMTTVLGHDVRHIQVPAEAMGATMRSNGAPPWVVEGLIELWAFYERGGAAVVSPDVERILGRPARSVEDFIRHQRSAFIDPSLP